MSEGLILEAASPAARTAALEALLKLAPYSSWRLFRAADTLGEAPDWERLEELLAKLSTSLSPFLLEGFHPSVFVREPDWESFGLIDDRIGEYDCRIVLLSDPSDGSEAQRRLRDCIEQSRLLALEIDTSSMDWDAHARTIAEFLG